MPKRVVFPARDGRYDYAKGYSRFDVRHRFTAAGAYSLPWLKNRGGLLESALGGWTVSGVIRYASGTPFTIVDGGAPDVLFLGTGMKPNRPICIDPNYCSGEVQGPSDNGKVPITAFRHAVYGDTLESFIGRNTYRSDGSQSIDAGVYTQLTDVEQEHYHLGLLDRDPGLRHRGVLGQAQAGGVDGGQLAAPPFGDAVKAVARQPRERVDDRLSETDQPVEERRFPDVGAADDSDDRAGHERDTT